jgi:hypothetical protein
VNSNSGNLPKSFTLKRNDRSRSPGIGVHDKTESAFTLVRNTQELRRVGCRLVIPVGTSYATGTRLLPTNSFRPRPPCGRSGDSTKHQPSSTAPTNGWTGCRMPLQIFSAGSGIHPLRHCENPHGPYPCRGLPAFAFALHGRQRAPFCVGRTPSFWYGLVHE